MKLLTSNFLTCAVKQCRGQADAYPLHFEQCELEIKELEFNPTFIRGIMPRIEWPALLAVCAELGNTSLPPTKPNLDDHDAGEGRVQEGAEEMRDEVSEQDTDQILKSLHNVLLETNVREGQMRCGRCGHIYPIKEGIANMLLAEHEVV